MALLAASTTMRLAAPSRLLGTPLSKFACSHVNSTSLFFPAGTRKAGVAGGFSSQTSSGVGTARCSVGEVSTETAPSATQVDAAQEKKSPEVSFADAEGLIGGLDLRVGRIIKAWKHPEADSLYVEEVDVGEAGGPRTICSGLVKYVTEEEMQDRLVVVLANLKPRNMRGVKSNGMLLAASDASHSTVQLLDPPAGSAPGDRLWFGREEEGAEAQGDPATPNQLQKKKIWEAVQPLLKTSEALEVVFGDRVLRTPAGPVTCTSLKGANVG